MTLKPAKAYGVPSRLGRVDRQSTKGSVSAEEAKAIYAEIDRIMREISKRHRGKARHQSHKMGVRGLTPQLRT